MKSLLIAGLAVASPALTGYALVLPLVAQYLDQRFGLEWILPDAARLAGLLIVAVGVAAAAWTLWSLDRRRRAVPGADVVGGRVEELVRRGPYRFSRNPLVVACGIGGFGLAFALASPALLIAYLGAAAAGVAYVAAVEEPLLEDRFGSAYREYVRRTPRWLGRTR